MAEELCCKARYDYDYDTTLGWLLIYYGLAEPGTAASAAGWRIRKYTYDANGNVTQIDWADGIHTFTKVWDNRYGYSYS